MTGGNIGQRGELLGSAGPAPKLAKIPAGEIVARHGSKSSSTWSGHGDEHGPLPHHLVSLLDMKRFYPDALMTLLWSIQTSHILLEMDARTDPPTAVDKSLIATLPDMITKAIAACSDLELPASLMSNMDVILAMLKDPDEHRNLPGALGLFVNGMLTELGQRQFMFMPGRDAEWFERPALFGQEVAMAFPSAEEDIREAGSCYAAGRYTASVYHAICALEPALKSLALSVRAKWNPTSTTWGRAVGAIEAAIVQIPVGKGDRKQFLSEAAAHFRFFKDAWRNDAMHARLKIAKESDAKDILAHVRAGKADDAVSMVQTSCTDHPGGP